MNRLTQNGKEKNIKKIYWTEKTKAEKICDKIIKDLSDRRGLGDEWEQIDEDIHQEIKDTWCKIIEAVLENINYKKVNYE